MLSICFHQSPQRAPSTTGPCYGPHHCYGPTPVLPVSPSHGASGFSGSSSSQLSAPVPQDTARCSPSWATLLLPPPVLRGLRQAGLSVLVTPLLWTLSLPFLNSQCWLLCRGDMSPLKPHTGSALLLPSGWQEGDPEQPSWPQGPWPQQLSFLLFTLPTPLFPMGRRTSCYLFHPKNNTWKDVWKDIRQTLTKGIVCA